MWSTAAVFYLGAMNPPTCLLYLHGMSGPERLKPSETSLIVSHSFRWTSDGGGVCVYTYRWVCVCVYVQAVKHKHSHLYIYSVSCSNAHRHEEWTCNTHFTAPHTPFTCFCFIMIFMPHSWLMTVLSWAFFVIFECLSLHPKPNQTNFVGIGQLQIRKNIWWRHPAKLLGSDLFPQYLWEMSFEIKEEISSSKALKGTIC